MKPETALVNKITKALTARGALVKKVHGSAFGRGWPDLIVITRLGTFFVEVKTPKKRPTLLQSVTMSKIRNAGGTAFWTDSVEHLITSIYGDERLTRPIAER